MSEALNTANNALNLLLLGIGLFLANNFRRQLQLKMVDRRLESYSRLWEILEVSGPWRTESGHGRMSLEERTELYDKMTSWYYGKGNGMLLAPVTRELYLNAKVNMICKDEDLRLNLKPEELKEYLRRNLKPEELKEYLSPGPEEWKLWRGKLTMDQLSLLRAQMRTDLKVFGLTYKKLEPLDKAFLKTADVHLWKKPWRRPLRKPWTKRRPERDRPIVPLTQKRSWSGRCGLVHWAGVVRAELGPRWVRAATVHYGRQRSPTVANGSE